ncbi:dynein light chain Tctex-type protein 2B [Drosophila tropicalis]|uniref:dynein light chain Tctex-type protein 2B n=1 Tax=Drosophila tropicalis TaxID=46794 RepID=UPI0035AB9EAC
MKEKRRDSAASIGTKRGSRPASRRPSQLNVDTQAAQHATTSQEPTPFATAAAAPSTQERVSDAAVSLDPSQTPQEEAVPNLPQVDGLSLVGASTVGSTAVPTPIDLDFLDAVLSHGELIPNANVSIYNAYNVGPAFGCKFPIPMIRLMVERLLKEKLDGKTYTAGEAVKWTRDVADDVNLRMKGACHQTRYKHVVNVMIYQQTGAGCFYGARAIWDVNSDDYFTMSYDGGSFVCIVTLFGCYQY